MGRNLKRIIPGVTLLSLLSLPRPTDPQGDHPADAARFRLPSAGADENELHCARHTRRVMPVPLEPMAVRVGRTAADQEPDVESEYTTALADFEIGCGQSS